MVLHYHEKGSMMRQYRIITYRQYREEDKNLPKKRRKVSDVAKQITIEDERIVAKFDDIKKGITMIVMEEKEDPTY